MKTNNIEGIQKTEKLLQLLNETMKTVRRISYALRPSLLDDLGLVPAMEWHLKEFNKHSGIDTFFHYPPDDIVLPDSFNIGLYRIFQESLTNIALHANANEVKIKLGAEGGHLVLSIADNGKGFDKETIKNKATLGILGMKERTSMMGGIYRITTMPGKGTTVIVTIPETKIRSSALVN